MMALSMPLTSLAVSDKSVQQLNFSELYIHERNGAVSVMFLMSPTPCSLCSSNVESVGSAVLFLLDYISVRGTLLRLNL